jgi:hypothetical protein
MPRLALGRGSPTTCAPSLPLPELDGAQTSETDDSATSVFPDFIAAYDRNFVANIHTTHMN